ncbi:hypothetical protein [Flavisolibacter ginsenosidimutans]|uniref:Uncharacterized protein n=1 Tax=Flavisolibacter ginsenosidimutans TaxID=661481 RepID=A0A5B8UEG1_9BACT|nr:hypothetical protein [Flavisolibacter ginsenosidimutans]QEC54812.1 hypothetical protein FSB75_02475 [Flavisolibacter ginsenosidimutans]
MNTVEQMREEVKNYIDAADEKIVKMVHAILEVDAADDQEWWEAMPDEVKDDVEEAIRQSDNDEVMSFAEVKQKYPQWFSK